MEILIVIVLIGVAVVAGYFIVKANPGKGAGKSVVPSLGRASRYDPEELRIENVGPGGVFSLRSFGKDMKDIDIRVLARHVYSENGWEWCELEGESPIGKIWLDVEEDDETELSVSLRRFGLTELGVTKEQLDRFDDEERGSFTFEGTDYAYEDSGEATFFREGDKFKHKPQRFYYWDFETRDGAGMISVERWSDGSFEVHLSQTIKASQITVYSNSGAA